MAWHWKPAIFLLLNAFIVSSVEDIYYNTNTNSFNHWSWVIVSNKIQYHYLGSWFIPKHGSPKLVFPKLVFLLGYIYLAFEQKSIFGEGVNRRTEANFHFGEFEQHENHLLEAPKGVARIFQRGGGGGGYTLSKWGYSPDCHVVFATCYRLFV